MTRQRKPLQPGLFKSQAGIMNMMQDASEADLRTLEQNMDGLPPEVTDAIVAERERRSSGAPGDQASIEPTDAANARLNKMPKPQGLVPKYESTYEVQDDVKQKLNGPIPEHKPSPYESSYTKEDLDNLNTPAPVEQTPRDDANDFRSGTETVVKPQPQAQPYTPDQGLMGRVDTAIEDADSTVTDAQKFADNAGYHGASVDNAASKAQSLMTQPAPEQGKSSSGNTFGQAFKAARSAGKQTFSWNGKEYHTRQADENQSQWKQKVGFAEGGMATGLMQPPSEEIGALPEEKADDVDAKLSEGEFVMPAEVVRWHGLEKLMQMRAVAKLGLMSMQTEGQINGGTPEPTPEAGHFADGGMVTPYGVGKGPDGRPVMLDKNGLPISSTTTAPTSAGRQSVQQNMTSQASSAGLMSPDTGGAPNGPGPNGTSPGGSREGMSLFDGMVENGKNVVGFLANPIGFAINAIVDPTNPHPNLLDTLSTISANIDPEGAIANSIAPQSLDTWDAMNNQTVQDVESSVNPSPTLDGPDPGTPQGPSSPGPSGGPNGPAGPAGPNGPSADGPSDGTFKNGGLLSRRM